MGLLSARLSTARTARVLPYVAGDVLDIGCQHGQLYEAAHNRISSYTGVDVDQGFVEGARRRFPEATFVVADLDEGVPDFGRAFDVVAMPAVVEHLFNLKVVFRGLGSQLKPGGRIVLTTPTVFGNDLVHRVGATLGVFARAAQQDHIVIFNAQRFRVLAAHTGLELERHRLFQIGCNQLAVLRRPG